MLRERRQEAKKMRQDVKEEVKETADDRQVEEQNTGRG